MDSINQSILFLAAYKQQVFQNSGQNGLGVFNFSYHVRNLTNNYQEGFTEAPPLDNCMGDSATESMMESTPPWLWIAVAIVVILLTILMFIVSIVLACIFRQKNKDLKLLQNQHGITSDENRKYTRMHYIF